MSYRLSSKKRQQRKNFWLRSFFTLIVISAGLGLFLLVGGTIATLGSQVVSGTQGIKDVLNRATIDKQELLITNTTLERELNQIKANNIAFDALVQRNNELLQLLGHDNETVKVLGGVIKKPPFSPYDIYTIDTGEADGVSVGDLALFSDFIALGQVTRTNNTGSKITLFSAPQKTTEMILQESVFQVIGQGGGTLRIDVPRDFDVQTGDSLTLPGYNLYVAGIVSEIVFKPQDSFKKVFAKVPVNIEQVTIVVTIPYIIQNSN